MNIKRPFAPKLINKLDNFLLLNKPSLWSTRAHLVWYYGLLFTALLTIICFAVPSEPRLSSDADVWAGLVSIISILAVVGWLIYLLRFNVFKRFGNVNGWTSLSDFLLYFLSAGLIISFAFVPMAVDSIRANRAFTSEELAKDINTINSQLCLLEYDSIPKNWHRDSIRVVDTLPGNRYVRPSPPDAYDETTEVTTDTAVAVYTGTPNRYSVIDTATLAERIHAGDSLVMINDSTYIGYTCPDYVFLFNSDVDRHSSLPLLNSKEIFFGFIQPYKAADRLATRKELKRLYDKYAHEGNGKRYYDIESTYYREWIINKYGIRDVNDSMENIAERKYRWADHGGELFLVWFYTTFVLTLFVFVYRRTTTRVFFLSVLTLIVLFILTMLAVAFFNTREIGFYSFSLVYFILFAILSATTFSQQKRTVVTGIAINLLVLMLPFIPMLILGWYFAWLDRQDEMISRVYRQNWEERFLYFKIVQYGGPLVFLALIPLYLHRLYRKWFASAEL